MSMKHKTFAYIKFTEAAAGKRYKIYVYSLYITIIWSDSDHESIYFMCAGAVCCVNFTFTCKFDQIKGLYSASQLEYSRCFLYCLADVLSGEASFHLNPRS